MAATRPILALPLLLVAGCAGGESEPMTTGDLGPRTLPPASAGLTIRQWRVEDDAARLEAALLLRSVGPAIDPEMETRFARNGLRLARIPADEIDGLLVDIGGTSIDIDGWHGQAYDWRALTTESIGPAGRAVAIDGRMRRLHGGKLRMLVRGWTAPMEDGPAMYFEMLPEFDQTRPSRLDQMLGRRTFVGERFGSLAVETFLEPGFAYVLTTVVETGSVAFADAADEPRDDERPAGGGVGPVLETPPTLGEMLLRRSVNLGPVRRDVFLFVPRIPETLYPDGAPSDPAIADRARRGGTR
jgi:hypothetical protein